ncbi:MAG TPA: N-acetylmuramoyl-L-alanine amidase [Vineibacter sp.]|nr:N-acetylmuramoyl-L-alanine amidase [Vineibacter sp.]
MAPFVDLPSNNHAARAPGASVDTLVLHHTAQPLDVSLELLRFGAVSSHYVVDANGDVYRLVDEARVAWHAGLSWWRDARGLNATSIGIEIVNMDGNLHPYPAAQRDAVIDLCRGLLRRHPAIAARNVVAHSDIAPQRKEDPGTLFFWRELAAAGVGLWSDLCGAVSASPPDDGAAAPALLRRFGYPPPHRYGRLGGRMVYVEGPEEGASEVIDVTLADIVSAFQRHHRPTLVDGVVDADTMTRLRDLLHQAGVGAA